MINKILVLAILTVCINATLIFTNSFLLNDSSVGNMTQLYDANKISSGMSYQSFNPDTNSYIVTDTQGARAMGASDLVDSVKSLGGGMVNLFFGTFTIGSAIGLPFIVIMVLSIPMIILSAIGLFFLMWYALTALKSLVFGV